MWFRPDQRVSKHAYTCNVFKHMWEHDDIISSGSFWCFAIILPLNAVIITNEKGYAL